MTTAELTDPQVCLFLGRTSQERSEGAATFLSECMLASMITLVISVLEQCLVFVSIRVLQVQLHELSLNACNHDHDRDQCWTPL